MVLEAAVSFDAPENRPKKAAAPAGTKLLRVAICCPELAMGWLSVVSLPVSWRRPRRFCLCRLKRKRTMKARMAAPARLPTTLPTTVGVAGVPSSLDAETAPDAAVLAEGGGAVTAGS